MQDETAVFVLCQALEARVLESEQAIDAYAVSGELDEEVLARLCGVAHTAKQFCVEASNQEQWMDELVARSTRKLQELRRLYRQLGGRDPEIVHAQCDCIAVEAVNGAILLSDAPAPRAPLTPLLCHQFDTERTAMAQYMAQCAEMRAWPCPLQEAEQLLRDLDAVPVADAVRRTLALFALHEPLREMARAVDVERANVMQHVTNVVERYAQCSRLVDATLAPQRPSVVVMASMFVPV